MLAEVDFDTRVGAYGLITDDDGRVLLALWNEGKFPQWTLPGGGLNLDETPEQALVREVREESGHDADAGLLLGVDVRLVQPVDRPSGRPVPLRLVRLIYTARVTGGKITAEEGGTTDEARWFAPEDVAALPRIELVDKALFLAAERQQR